MTDLRHTPSEPLPTWSRWGLFGLVIVLHGAGLWALSRVEAARLIVGEVATLEVRLVPAEAEAPQPDPDLAPPDLAPPDLAPPVLAPSDLVSPDLPPPIDVASELTKLETVLEQPPPDLPPPVFPLAAAPPPPKAPPQPPKPPPPTKTPPSAASKAAAKTPAPSEPSREQAIPQAPAAPRTVSASQVQFLEPLAAAYPAKSRRNGETGTVVIKVMVDIAGRPTNVSLQQSSKFPALDDSALAAVRGARFRPYAEAGAPQPVWVLIPVQFVLK